MQQLRCGHYRAGCSASVQRIRVARCVGDVSGQLTVLELREEGRLYDTHVTQLPDATIYHSEHRRLDLADQPTTAR